MQIKTFLKTAALTLPLLFGAALAQTTVTIKHDEGSTVVPKNPKRVVVISEEMLDIAFALKLNMIGVASPRILPTDVTSAGKVNIKNIDKTFFKFGNMQNITYVGNWMTPNYETLLALKPDLIIRLYWQGLGEYQKLSQIAPTLSFSTDRPDGWKSAMNELSKLGGKEARAKQFLNDYDRKVKAARAQLQKAGVFKKYSKFMVVCSFASGTDYLYTGNRVANVMRALGFTYNFPEGIKDDGGLVGVYALSKETLVKVPADTLVINIPFTNGVEDTIASIKPSQDLLKQSKGHLVNYIYPAYSPWLGPNTDRQMVQDLTTAILQSVK